MNAVHNGLIFAMIVWCSAIVGLIGYVLWSTRGGKK